MEVLIRRWKYILKKLKNKKNRSAFFVCSLSLNLKKKLRHVRERFMEKISKILGKKVLDMILYYTLRHSEITFGQMAK